MSKVKNSEKVTVLDLQKMKAENKKITMLTAYDYTMATLVDGAGTDIVLVGDSLGMVIQGQDNTIPVTMEHMIYHSQAVSRGLKRAHLVVDMPFMSYYEKKQALENAARLMRDGKAESVKLEGGDSVAEIVYAITRAGIPVMGHIGLTPQSVHALGGFKVQGRDFSGANKLKSDAITLQDAGVYSLVIEGVPSELAMEITSLLRIPTIGIGAGGACDGQVLVLNDLLGMDRNFKPKFVKQYASLHGVITEAIQAYIKEVRSNEFPSVEHTFKQRRDINVISNIHLTA